MTILFIIIAALTAGVTLKSLASLSGAQDRRLRLILATAMPVLSLALYLMLGSPELRGSPVLFSDLIERDMRQMALLAERPMQVILEKDPNNASALASLGKISMRLKKYESAEKFFARALEHVPKTSDAYIFTLLDLGQAQVASANGQVTPAAERTFEELRVANPMGNLSRHYLALAKAQRGQHEQALKEWTSLLRDVPGNIYWKKDIRAEMAKSRAALSAKKNP